MADLSCEEPTFKDIARILYLYCFTRKDGTLWVTSKTRMRKKHIGQILGLKRSALESFLVRVWGCGWVSGNGDDTWKINTEAFIPRISDDCHFLEHLNLEAFRLMYENTPVSKHQYIGYVISQMKLVNTEWNVLCSNPEEDIYMYVEPMSVGEFCDAVGYGRTNAQRLIKNFHSIRFPCNGEMQRFCSFVDMRIFINPNVFYAGKHPEQVEALGLFFEDPVD